MESHWETRAQAPIVMFAIPDETQEKQIEIGSIPGLLSFLGFHDFNAEVIGLQDIPKQTVHRVLPTFVGFRTMRVDLAPFSFFS